VSPAQAGPETRPGTYRAFLSYTHADAEIAQKLHTWLETFRVPAGLPDAEEFLRPVFLDEAELGATPALPERLRAALDASQALVIVASPAAAKSPWVEQEILYFRSKKPESPCLAIIVGGQPFAADEAQECFPKSLKYRVRDGKLTSERHDLLASDLVKQGEEGAFLRLAAGLIGANFSDLFDRHAAREAAIIKRQRRALAKAYTIPARDAASTGHHERVLKYMLAYVLEANDPEWYEAPELEALAHDAARALACKSVLRVEGVLVTQVLYSPAGDMAATVLSCDQCVLWEPEAGRATAILGDRRKHVSCAAFSPDGATLLTGGDDGHVDLWEVGTGNHVARLDGLTGDIKHVQFAGNGTLIVAASEQQFRLWEARSHAAVGGIADFGMRSHHLAVSPDAWTLATIGDASASRSEQGRCLRLWDVRTGQVTARLKEHLGDVTCLQFSPDGRRLVSGADDQLVIVWNIETGQAERLLLGHGDPTITQRLAAAARDYAEDDMLRIAAHAGRITAVAFSPDGNRILTASADKTARVWDAHTGALLAHFARHTATLSSGCFSPDGSRVVTTAFDEFRVTASDLVARVWDSRSGTELHRLVGHERAVMGAIFDPTGQRILSRGGDCTVRTWAVAAPHELVRLSAHKGQVLEASFACKGGVVLSRSLAGEARLWNALTGDLLFGSVDCTAVGLSLSGGTLAIGTREGHVRVHDLTTGSELLAMPVVSGQIDEVAVSPDGALIAFTALDGREHVFGVINVSNPSMQARCTGHEGAVAHLRFLRGATRLIAADGSQSILVWNPITGQTVRWPTEHLGRILDLVLSQDCARLATASGDDHALVLDMETGHIIARLEGHSRSVRAVAFSLDALRVGTASSDKSAIVWKVQDGTQIARMYHDDEVRSVRFDASGDRLITGSNDNTARIWDAGTGRQLASLTGHGSVRVKIDDIPRRLDPIFDTALGAIQHNIGVRSAVTQAEFSPDGRRALTASVDGTVRLWDVSDTALRGAALTALICKRMQRGIGVVAGEDMSDLLFRDVIPEGHEPDLGAAILAKWPHLLQMELPEPLSGRLDTLLAPAP
jgi:WD40 repeat protein